MYIWHKKYYFNAQRSSLIYQTFLQLIIIVQFTGVNFEMAHYTTGNTQFLNSNFQQAFRV